jgi:hypothetical protein
MYDDEDAPASSLHHTTDRLRVAFADETHGIRNE